MLKINSRFIFNSKNSKSQQALKLINLLVNRLLKVKIAKSIIKIFRMVLKTFYLYLIIFQLEIKSVIFLMKSLIRMNFIIKYKMRMIKILISNCQVMMNFAKYIKKFRMKKKMKIVLRLLIKYLWKE